VARLRMKFSAPSGNASNKAPGHHGKHPDSPGTTHAEPRAGSRHSRALAAYTVAGAIDLPTPITAGRDAELGGSMNADRTITQKLRIKVWPCIRASSHRCLPLCRACARPPAVGVKPTDRRKHQ
jgi:hypothetical protein